MYGVSSPRVQQNGISRAIDISNNIDEGLAIASLAGSIGQILPRIAGKTAVKGLTSAAQSLSKDEITILNNAADNVLKTSGLADKGVKIINITEASKNLPSHAAAAAKGQNAFFTSGNIKGVCKANSVVLNRQKLPNSVFHELGHAYNFNLSPFWKSMQKLRVPGTILASAFAFYGALSKQSEKKDGDDLNILQKTNNFIRNNAGKLAFISSLPMLTEEITASVRGSSWADKLLPKNLAQKITKTHAFGALSYAAAALGTAFAAYSAVKIKNQSVEAKKAGRQFTLPDINF